MPVLNKARVRSRCVVFRLSPEEYAALRSASLAANRRSISDYMRGRLLGVAHSEPSDSGVERRFSEIDQRLEELHSLVEVLSSRISTL